MNAPKMRSPKVGDMVYITAWFFPYGIIRAPVAAVIPRTGQEPGIGVYFYAAQPGENKNARGRSQSWLWDNHWYETLDEARVDAARKYAKARQDLLDELGRLETDLGSLPVREVT